MPGQQPSQPTRLRWVKGVGIFRCNLPLALLADDWGLLRATAVTRGVGRTPNKSQHTKLTQEKNILPPHLTIENLHVIKLHTQ